MLTQTIPAYIYQEYADDENVQALNTTYNEMAQAYVTWGATVGLPYYPGLSGQLLAWTVQGLYGITASALASQVTPATGPLDTVMLDTTQLDSGTPASQTFYATTDDLFKRIITWHFFKGDGKRFCMRWFKRRIARFIFGLNGIDPVPWVPGFTTGPENTSAISVVVASHAITINLNQALISAQGGTNLTPGILTLFQLAMQGGLLEIPAQYLSVTVNIQSMLSVSVNPTTQSSVGTAATQTTGTSTVSENGGSGSYTYSWTWKSGGTGITINTPSAGATSFTAAGLTVGEGVSGVALITVTDTITSNTASATVTVSIERGSAVSATASPTSLSVTGGTAEISTTSTTITAIGGSPPYTYSWSWQSGGVGIEILSPASATTDFQSTSLAPGSSVSGTAQCVVTDSFGQQTIVTVPVTINRVSVVSLILSSTSLTTTSASASTFSVSGLLAEPSGGSGSYTYSWAWQSGGTGIQINGTSNAEVNFETFGQSPGTTLSGTAVCTVTDGYGQTAQATCNIFFIRVPVVSASVSPTSESSVGTSPTQTTGAVTVTGSGGGGVLTYAWVWSSGGSHLAINSPSSASTTFTGSSMVGGTVYTGTAKCTVTDGYGQTASVTVSVSITCGNVYTGTMVAGSYSVKLEDPTETFTYFGYAKAATSPSGATFGSISPATTIDGKTIDQVLYYLQVETITIEVGGFSTNPGVSYFGSLVTNGHTYAATSASYSYNPSTGIATWEWPGFAYTSGDSYSVVLTNP